MSSKKPALPLGNSTNGSNLTSVFPSWVASPSYQTVTSCALALNLRADRLLVFLYKDVTGGIHLENTITVSPREAARLIGISYGTVMNRIRAGLIRARHLSRKQIVILRVDLEAYLLAAPSAARTRRSCEALRPR